MSSDSCIRSFSRGCYIYAVDLCIPKAVWPGGGVPGGANVKRICMRGRFGGCALKPTYDNICDSQHDPFSDTEGIAGATILIQHL